MQASRRPENGKGHEVLGHRGLRPGAKALLVLCSLLPGVPTTPFQAFGASRLPLLMMIRQAHSLRQEEAALGYPVRLHVVVTYYDPPNNQRHAAFFVSDATGGIFVRPPEGPMRAARAGTPMEITGVTAPGDFAPIIIHSTLRALGPPQRLPQAPRDALPHMQTGADDAKWVEVEGMVHSVELDAKDFVLTLATSDGPLTATTPVEGGDDYANLIDSKVLVRGVAAALFNKKREMAGIWLLFRGWQRSRLRTPSPPIHFRCRSSLSIV